MRFNTSYDRGDTLFFDGALTSSLVPFSYPISLNGIPYLVDFNQPFYRQYRRQMASIIRTQADTSTDPGEQTLDPNGLWRRSFEDWSLGQGQRYLDRHESVSNGFWTSKGIDALTTKWQISLLADTEEIMASTAQNLQLLNVGNFVYFVDGHTVYFTSTVSATPTYTTVTGLPSETISSACTDGYDLWFACGAGGVYTTTAGATTATQYVTSAIDSAAILGYCNGRLMLATTNQLFNLVASGTLPTVLFTAGNPNFRFTSFAQGNAAIYAAGGVGSISYIYGITVTSDGTTLSAPVIQGQLPNGETASCVYGYLGYLVVGTSLGVRFCTADPNTGAITLQALIPTPAAVKCAVGYGRWVWFGWTDYDNVSTGLGRLDLENFVVAGTLPASASDLMATGQGAVSSVVNYNGTLVFAVINTGFFAESTTQLVASGTVDSGYILYDLVDTKIATLLDVQTVGPLTYGSYSAAISTDGGPFDAIGSHSAGQAEPVQFGANTAGERFEVALTLTRDANTLTAGPTITRWTLRSYPAPIRPLTWQLPLILNEETEDMSGDSGGFLPLARLQALESMLNSRALVTFQEGDLQYPVFVSDVAFLPDYQTENKTYFNGTALVTLLGVPGQS